MTRTRRLSISTAAIVAAGVLAAAGCGANAVAGHPEVKLNPTSPHTVCADVTHGDPWVAFADPLHDGDTLKVGQRSWISSPAGGASAITVGGDAGAVTLSDEHAATVIKCGVTAASRTWVEVHANTPGTATLTMPGSTAPMHVTVTAR